MSRRRGRVLLDSDDEDGALTTLCTQNAPSHPPSSQPTLGGLLSRVPLRPAPKRELAADADTGAAAPAPPAPGSSHLWCEKYEPRSLDELAVAKKKLEVIRGWLTHQQTLGGGVRPGRCLVLSGPAGTGKSTAARLVAQAAGFEVMEWTPPMPTLWDEHTSTSVGGHNAAGYTSKMEAFESWLERSRTMAPLTLALATVSLGGAPVPPLPLEADGDDDSFMSAPLLPPLPAPRPKLLLLEDIPLTAGVGGAAKQRLTAALTSLALASRYPSILCLTDSMASELGDDSTLGMRELAASLERSSAAVIAVNPATRAELQKLLIRVSAAEGISLAPNDAAHMAEAARGDIRAALSTLQMHCAGVRRRPGGVPQPQAKRRKTAKGGAEAAVSQQVDTRVWERSDTLTVFHSLGKVLYAKRVVPTPPASADASGLLAQHVRLPLEVASPEAVLAQAGLSASTALAFLHENAPDFVGADAIEDYADVVAYFSDAAVLLAPSLRGSGGGRGGAIIIAEVDDLSTGARAAVGVASRGYMFANAHPAPHTFRQIRGPAGTAVERDGRAQGVTIARRVAAAVTGNDACAGGSVTVAASQVLPYLRLIAVTSPELAWCLPPRKAVGGGAGGDDAAWSSRGMDTAWDIDRGGRGAAAAGGLGGPGAGGVGPPEEEDPIEDPDT